ncbi:cyclophilin-like fold protein [Rhodococcoides yunnanense]|uniref:Cyclophilin-like fold protein n=1 Tax=Rhodococcoides yunnanense TaxID=278209 RepID=A0ABU4B6A1_9NOCA|nr:cyclophilin-like fold protein [Rhodococcus yunnanensis]MDV6259724.1 cyclophilin-like fold protein [Rhodococcus yunnanensis]
MTDTRRRTIAGVSASMLLLASCSSASEDVGGQSPTTSADAPSSTSDASTVVGTVVRFRNDRQTVDVVMDNNTAATADLVAMLPLTLTIDDFASSEKVAYLPRELNHAGTPGSDPDNGDFVYYVPWGNLVFYYDATGIEFSEDTLHLGTFDATAEQLARLEGGIVTAEVAT